MCVFSHLSDGIGFRDENRIEETDNKAMQFSLYGW
jgi:hypothetical protein